MKHKNMKEFESDINKMAKKGWQVVFAGLGVNLALGILYSWSVFAQSLRDDLGWSATDTQIPYMLACGIFALVMVPGGRIQDKIGPRVVIMAAGIMAGLGLIASSFFLSIVGLSIFFGIFFGTALGLGYSSTTPPVVKWFAPEKRGLVTGIVVGGFGLSSVYAAPLSNYLVNAFGLMTTFLIIGASFFLIIMLLAQFINNPPAQYQPASSKSVGPTSANRPDVQRDFEWYEMLKTPQFYLIWLMFCFGSLAGLMIIGQLSSIALEQAGVAAGFLIVAVLAIFNAGGRVIGGVMFDKLGRTPTLLIIFIGQSINFALFSMYNNLLLMLVGTIVAGLFYGACLSVFPATTATLFGVKNLGINYGLVFVAWGAGGVFGGLLGGLVRDLTGAYLYAYLVAAALCLAGAALALLIKPVFHTEPLSDTMVSDAMAGKRKHVGLMDN